MPLPNVTTVIKNGGLGLALPSKDGVFAIIGTAVSGSANTPLVFGNISDACAVFGDAIVDVSGVCNNDLVNAADNAFQNGAASLWLVKCEDKTTAKILAAVDSLLANDEIRGVYIATAAAPDLIAGLKSKSEAFFNAFRPCFFVCEADTAVLTPAALATAYSAAGTVGDYVACVAGSVWTINYQGKKVNSFLGGCLMGILARSPVSRSAGYVRYNGLSNAVGLAPRFGQLKAYTEAEIELLDSKKLITARTITGVGGIYITMDNTLYATGSDYVDLRTVRTMFKAIRECRSAILPNLNADFPSQGDDLLAAMKNLEAQGMTPLNRMKANGEISDAVVSINTNQDFVGTNTVKISLGIMPRFISKFIVMQFGLVNPK